MRWIARLVVLGSIAANTSILFGQRGGEPFAATTAEGQRCAALARAELRDVAEIPVRVLSARLVTVPGSGLSDGRGGASLATSIKQYCQVTGYVAPQNKFELRLPLAGDWNQRFFFTPCAGFCGGVNGEACNPSLARGYASVTHNGGHDGVQGFDGVWAANDPRLQEDFGWRGVHLVTRAAKALTTQYYARPIVRSYISGCSKGGQSVLKEAQQFPDDYDGYLPIAPVYDFVGRIVAGAWFAQAVNDGHGRSVLDEAAAAAVHKSVLARCGAQGGVDEGLVTDPARCDWRPELIACAGATGTDCLTPPQVAAVKRLMSPVVTSKGDLVYRYPYLPGTETEWSGWNYAGDTPVINNLLHGQFLRFMADPAPRANADALTFDFDRGPATLARARQVYDATSTDLRAVKARGGKVLMWHGLADAGIVASSSIGYYEAVTKTMRGRQDTEDFFRLFLVPGVHHCAGGPGLTNFDALTLLENWVEKGQAPDVLVAQRLANGAVERSRPIYPYPVLARYSGSGDPKQAASFVPFDPTIR
jgi:feruloyl esterase